MKVNRMKFFVHSMLFYWSLFLFIPTSNAVIEAPCCPPSLSKLSKAIASQLKQITNSSSYLRIRMVILALLGIMILYVVVLILLAVKREAKASKEKTKQEPLKPI